jgi:hypothetical protein
MNNFYTEKKSEKNTTAATIDKRRSHAIDVSDSNDSSAIRKPVWGLEYGLKRMLMCKDVFGSEISKAVVFQTFKKDC